MIIPSTRKRTQHNRRLRERYIARYVRRHLVQLGTVPRQPKIAHVFGLSSTAANAIMQAIPREAMQPPLPENARGQPDASQLSDGHLGVYLTWAPEAEASSATGSQLPRPVCQALRAAGLKLKLGSSPERLEHVVAGLRRAIEHDLCERTTRLAEEACARLAPLERTAQETGQATLHRFKELASMV